MHDSLRLSAIPRSSKSSETTTPCHQSLSSKNSKTSDTTVPDPIRGAGADSFVREPGWFILLIPKQIPAIVKSKIYTVLKGRRVYKIVCSGVEEKPGNARKVVDGRGEWI